MARFTPAYSSFVDRLREIDDLRRTAAAREREDAIGNRHHISALCRGSIVLLCAHLEAYIREIGETTLDAIVTKHVDRSVMAPRFFYHISKPILKEIKDTIDHDKLAEKVFDFLSTEHRFWERNGPFTTAIPVEAFNEGFSNPAYSKICTYFNRFGCNTYKLELGRRLGSDFQPVTNMVDHLVEIRNKIAHGDPIATKTPSELTDMITIIKLFCGATDSVFASWCTKNLCAIR